MLDVVPRAARAGRHTGQPAGPRPARRGRPRTTRTPRRSTTSDVHRQLEPAGLVARDRATALGTHVGVDNDVNLAAVAERRRGVGRRRRRLRAALARRGRSRSGHRHRRHAAARRARRRRRDRLHAAVRPRRLQPQSGTAGPVSAAPAVLALARSTASPGVRPAEVGHGRRGRPGRQRRRPFFNALADRVAIGLAAVIAVLDPWLVVLAGQVAQAGGDRAPRRRGRPR